MLPRRFILHTGMAVVPCATTDPAYNPDFGGCFRPTWADKLTQQVVPCGPLGQNDPMYDPSWGGCLQQTTLGKVLNYSVGAVGIPAILIAHHIMGIGWWPAIGVGLAVGFLVYRMYKNKEIRYDAAGGRWLPDEGWS